MIKDRNKIDSFRSFMGSPQSRVVAVLLMLTIFATSVFAAFTASYTVDVVDDGETIQITTTRSEPMEILDQCEKVVGDKDKIDISAFESGKGGSIVISRAKAISIEYCGVISNYQVFAPTVKGVIEEVGLEIPEGSTVNYALDEKALDGMVISIVIPNPVQIYVDGIMKATIAVNTNVGQLLADNGIVLGAEDIVTPVVETAVEPDMVITVNRVSYQDIVETQGIPRKEIVKKTASLNIGETQLETEGSDGAKDVTFKIKLVDGVEVERTFLSENITAPAINAVTLKGTKSNRKVVAAAATTNEETTTQGLTSDTTVSNPSRSWNGISEGSTFGGKGSHYCACASCNGSGAGTTSSGMKIWNGMENPYIVACNWLPLGTVVRVNGVTYRVMDRGGSGLNTVGRLDIFTPGGHALCYQLGTPKISIEIVSLSATN